MKALALAGLLGLTACAPLERPAPLREPAPVSEAAPARAGPGAASREILAYLGRLRTLDAPALETEAARAREAARRERSDVARVKAALATALTSAADEGDVATLLEPVVRGSPGDPTLKAMAGFLQGFLQRLSTAGDAERRRLREGSAAAAAKLREEHRAFEAQKQRADLEQERAAQLQQKLDALTNLEKSLTDKEPRVPDAPTR
jgi:hypothetical protein